MPSQWFYPSAASQYTESHTHNSWVGIDSDFNYINDVRTTLDLTTIDNDVIKNMKTKTYYLVFTDFKISEITYPINGIELFVNIRRGGRITDDTISLYYNNDVLGTNKATAELNDIKTYGSSTDLWDAQSTAKEVLEDTSFGVLLRYQSHPFWPHRTTPNMQHVQLRIW